MTRSQVLKCATVAHLLPIAILLASCAGPMGQLHPDLSAQSYAGQRYDGSYSGTITLGSYPPEFTGMCWQGGPFNVLVQNATFQYLLTQPNIPGHPSAAFNLHFDEKGNFSDQSTAGEVSMAGKVTDKRMTGIVDGVNCVYKFQADR
jgi:hypothetical protein